MTVPPSALGALDPDAPLPFGRNSLVRAAVAEPVTALLVQRALVMEVAHPKVAAAVAHHSHFQRRPLARAWVTVDAALRLVFGDERTARGAARQIYGVHDHIHGHVETPDGLRPEHDGDGTSTADDSADSASTAHDTYTAHDASLLAWVWATLVDTTEMAFTRWVRPFDADRGRHLLRRDAVRSPAFSAFPRICSPPIGRPSRATSRTCCRGTCSARPRRAGPWPARSCGSTTASSPPRSSGSSGCSPSPPSTPASWTGSRSDPTGGDAELGRRLDAWLRAYYRRVPRLPRLTPSLYVLMRRPSVDLVGRARSALAQVWPCPTTRLPLTPVATGLGSWRKYHCPRSQRRYKR